jgi:hypothetical protein
MAHEASIKEAIKLSNIIKLQHKKFVQNLSFFWRIGLAA